MDFGALCLLSSAEGLSLDWLGDSASALSADLLLALEDDSLPPCCPSGLAEEPDSDPS